MNISQSSPNTGYNAEEMWQEDINEQTATIIFIIKAEFGAAEALY